MSLIHGVERQGDGRDLAQALHNFARAAAVSVDPGALPQHDDGGWRHSEDICRVDLRTRSSNGQAQRE